MSLARTRAYAPATLANLAVGFDVLGLAVQPADGSLWGDVVTVTDAPPGDVPLGVESTGPHAGDLPPDPAANLVHAVAVRFLARLPDPSAARPVRIVLEKNLPVSSGLGGSASSAVAALVALNRHFGDPLAKEDLLPLAGYAEGWTSGAEHYDNVAPALLGGVCLLEGRGAEGVVPLPWPEGWLLVLVVPRFRIQTREARRVLPAMVDLADAVHYARNLALFVAALYRGDADLARVCFEDTLIEPARRGLLPGFVDAKAAALAGGALGCSLSGSGPTTFAVATDEAAARRIAGGMVEAFGRAGLVATSRLARVDRRGARILECGADR